MDQVAQIREKIDIVSFLSEFLTLKKAGRNFKAVCPFHNEKSPSFMVSPERQVWHCFGCSKGGDIYTFLMDYEKVEFPEALRILAKRAGVELIQSKEQMGISSKKELLYKINSIALEYYHFILTKHKVGEKARIYLNERGLTDKIIETFQLGFAPGVGTALSSYLQKKKGYSVDDLVTAGLSFPRGRDAVDFFRGRLMFPLIDHRDNVVGFSGRVLDKDIKTSKYINTRETLIYHKGEGFYGLNITKDVIRREGQAILVEGEFDVISSFKEGVSNVVAVKGTALTEMQIGLIARYAPKISICFDGDKAGQEAIKRSLPLIEKKGLQASIILLPNGKDPDESIKTNPVLYKQAVKKDISVYDYLFESSIKSGDSKTAEGKKAIADAFLPVVSLMSNEIIKEHYLRKLSTILETTYETVVKELERLKQSEKGMQVKIPPLKIQKQSREEMLEDYLTSLIIQFEKPKLALDKSVLLLSPTLSKEKAYQKILTHLLEYFKNREEFNHQDFSMLLPEELLHSYNKSTLFPLPPLKDKDQYLNEVEKVAKQLRDLYLRDRLKVVSEELVNKEKNDNEAEGLQLLKEEYSTLIGLLKQMN